MSMDKDATMRFNGQEIPIRTGQSVGAALTDAGIRSWRTTRKNARPRGLFCGIGICFDCLVTVDGQPNQRACMVPAQDGMCLEPGGPVIADARLPLEEQENH